MASPADVPIVRHLYTPPDALARAWFAARMEQVRRFASEHGVPVQAWSAFSMDGIVWLTGAGEALMMAMDDPRAFGDLADVVAEAD